MTVAFEADQTITYELVNTHKRRAHIRAILLRAKGHWARNRVKVGLVGGITNRPPIMEEVQTL